MAMQAYTPFDPIPPRPLLGVAPIVLLVGEEAMMSATQLSRATQIVMGILPSDLGRSHGIETWIWAGGEMEIGIEHGTETLMIVGHQLGAGLVPPPVPHENEATIIVMKDS